MPIWLSSGLEDLLDFSNILNTSISASWLILAVIGLRLVLKRAPRWVNVALWGIVALRLLLPVSLESSMSLVPSAEIVPQELLRTEAALGQQPAQLQIVTNPNFGNAVSVELPRTIESVQWDMVGLTFLWIAGAALMLGYTVFTYLSLRRRLTTAVRLRGNIYQCEGVQSPFVLGLIRPRIYLPYGMEDLHVIAHEQAHIRRRDHWWKPLGFLLLTVHWFNPLMWVAYILLCRDIELACDEKVIRELGYDQRADYTQALLACSVGRRRIAACPLAFGEVGVKERVKSILHYRKPGFWIVVTAIVLCVVVAVCFLTDPKHAPQFSMKGGNVSDLEPSGIVERIMDYQDIENSNVYTNANNFSLTVDADFDWVDFQAIRYFYYQKQVVQSAQLRLLPADGEYFLTESDEWPEQNRIFLLQHYLDALKYLPQDAIRELAPADRYLIELVDGGAPSDYERVISYSARGVGENNGWFIHLRILPHHEVEDAYHGTGGEVVHLFYGDSAGKGSDTDADMWFDFTDDPEKLDWNRNREYFMDEFPGVTFRCSPYEMAVGDTILIQGMPIWSAYLQDLNGDGYPEICTETSFGSGMIDFRIVIYDYANRISYLLEDRGRHDYYLLKNAEDGQLYVEKRIYNSDVTLSAKPLDLEDSAVSQQTGPVSVLMAKVLDIEDEHFLVEPVEGSPELNSSSRFMVPMRNMAPSPEPQIGDVLQIEYDGMFQEVYPARITNVYRISVAALAPVAGMIPTDTDLEGLCAGALFVPVDGNTYRYLLTDTAPEGVTVDALLFSFDEIDIGERVPNQVYSLKEYPDHRKVLLISPKTAPWLCTYSAPQCCAEDALDNAKESGAVIMEDGIATHGQEIWKEFYERVQRGEAATVTVAHYLTLDPERCDSGYYEAFRQDYPCLLEYRLDYDGKTFALTEPDGEGVRIRNYAYLMKYDNTEFYAQSYKTPVERFDYVLTQDNHVTWEQLWNGLISSQAGAYIDHYSIYSELKK